MCHCKFCWNHYMFSCCESSLAPQAVLWPFPDRYMARDVVLGLLLFVLPPLVMLILLSHVQWPALLELKMTAKNGTHRADNARALPSRIPEGFCRSNYTKTYFQQCRFACLQDEICREEMHKYGSLKAKVSDESLLQVVLTVEAHSRVPLTRQNTCSLRR
eukprot:TRINITY_DN26203_c0_g1_i7.p2 TRINITY_DN26203_c0_g1~~TRINITY_DN26203_c0_g1_i7.p2  ORF type:complete len:160 (-),score=9.96 TRINITY_DN26203_c0_g1_i7:788-1267(-)